jgi:flavin reductase (DIM6/NTAB) family NADH-FMN oxidoreductase RutF
LKKSLGPRMLLPAPVWVIGTYDAKGQPNMMTAGWVGIACSSPATVSVSIRESTATYSNLMTTRAFTVNVPSAARIREADFFGMVSGRDSAKLSAAGIVTRKAEHVYAPYLDDFPLILECEMRRSVRVGMHTLITGEVRDVKAEEEILGDNGLPRMDRLDPVLFMASDANYYRVEESLGRTFTIGNDLLVRLDAAEGGDVAAPPPIFKD